MHANAIFMGLFCATPKIFGSFEKSPRLEGYFSIKNLKDACKTFLKYPQVTWIIFQTGFPPFGSLLAQPERPPLLVADQSALRKEPFASKKRL